EAGHDPIAQLERKLISGKVLTAAQADAIRAEADATVAQAAKEALAAARPDPKRIEEHVYALPNIPEPPEDPGGDEVLAFGEAIWRVLHERMAADERIWVFGGGVAVACEQLMR